jgi:hypothetical protein
MPYIDTRTPESSVLASLRTLIPKRPLTHAEGLRLAELQANRLLESFEIGCGQTPIEIISELPRFRVHYAEIPVSGAAHWNGRHWIITVNAAEPETRQRFSVAHEFKHILDHTTRQYLYESRMGRSAAEQAERAADYFAACLLMPKRVVKRLWGEHRDPVTLAMQLHVSASAIHYRLHQLGLTEPERCAPPVRHALTYGGRL